MTPESMPTTPSLRFRLPIQDLLGLVIGYGMAALFFRAFWPIQGLHPTHVVPAIGLYIWLGLAMSSPALLARSWSTQVPLAEPAKSKNRPGERTGSEIAWLWIGIYWITLALFVIPCRLTQFRARDTILLGLLPCLAVVLARCLKPRPHPESASASTWTRHAAIGVVATWPLAWICLMILGRAII